MIIIGISGKKRSGKDTACEAIANIPELKPIRRIAFADALKEEVCAVLGISTQELEDNKVLYRPLLQWWGTEYRRSQDENYWINKLFSKLLDLPDNCTVVVPDVRFLNEATSLTDVGAIMVRVTRDTGLEDSHASEIDLDKHHNIFHLTIPNNTTKQQFQENVQTLITLYVKSVYTTGVTLSEKSI